MLCIDQSNIMFGKHVRNTCKYIFFQSMRMDYVWMIIFNMFYNAFYNTYKCLFILFNYKYRYSQFPNVSCQPAIIK